MRRGTGRADRPGRVPVHPGRRPDAHRRRQGRGLRRGGDPAFAAYARQVVANARTLAAALAARGFSVTTGGTDTHLVTADPAPLGVDGRAARTRLAAAGIVVDTCALPHGHARGIRLGTAAVTTQGMGPAEMERTAELFASALRGPQDPPAVREAARELAAAFSPYRG